VLAAAFPYGDCASMDLEMVENFEINLRKIREYRSGQMKRHLEVLYAQTLQLQVDDDCHLIYLQSSSPETV
jgi:hypothetical protein